MKSTDGETVIAERSYSIIYCAFIATITSVTFHHRHNISTVYAEYFYV